MTTDNEVKRYLDPELRRPLAGKPEGEDGARGVGHVQVAVGLVVAQSNHVIFCLAHLYSNVLKHLQHMGADTSCNVIATFLMRLVS